MKKLFLVFFLSVTPLLATPCEFPTKPVVIASVGNVSEKGSRLTQVWDVDTINQPWIGGVNEIQALVVKELRGNSDWKLALNLHNHNFFLEKDRVLGVTSPSSADVGAFRQMATELGMDEAWITNGFHTARLAKTTFWKFHTRESRNLPR